jgi:hypothetical protein
VTLAEVGGAGGAAVRVEPGDFTGALEHAANTAPTRRMTDRLPARAFMRCLQTIRRLKYLFVYTPLGHPIR